MSFIISVHKAPGGSQERQTVPKEHPQSAPRPLSLQASEHLNLGIASAGAEKRKQFRTEVGFLQPSYMITDVHEGNNKHKKAKNEQCQSGRAGGCSAGQVEGSRRSPGKKVIGE